MKKERKQTAMQKAQENSKLKANEVEQVKEAKQAVLFPMKDDERIRIGQELARLEVEVARKLEDKKEVAKKLTGEISTCKLRIAKLAKQLDADTIATKATKKIATKSETPAATPGV